MELGIKDVFKWIGDRKKHEGINNDEYDARC